MVDGKALEQRLRDLRPYLDYPPAPNLVVAVRTRLVTAPRRPWYSSFAIPRRLALAAAAVLIVIGGLLAIPQTRDTIAHWFGVKGVIVNTVPSLPPGPLGHDLNLGQRTTLAGAQAGAHFQVLVPTDTTLTEVTVNGGPGYWIEGSPHVFFFTDAQGAVHDEDMRLATNTLLWQQGDRTLRIEGAATKAQALQIAASMH